jgi:peptide/nickel transport system substrate-binding protein
LTFHLRQGVRWHDGKPFTAADVKCTWDALAGKTAEKFRVNPRKSWYRNLDEMTTNGDYELTFHLKRPQPYLIALLASGQSPVYPCHVPLRDMRGHPIGTGPLKFVEYKPNERITVTRNPDYWKPERPPTDSRGSFVRTTRSGLRSARVASTSPTRNSIRPMFAAPTATTPAIVIPKPML